jgi:predicted kinase
MILILIGGLPGSGKTYFAEQLAAKTGFVYLGSDKVRKSVGASGKYTVHDKLSVYLEMKKMAGDHLSHQKNVIIDATFSRQEMRDIFIGLAKRKAASLLLIWVHAQESVIRDRLMKPRKDSEADFAIYQKIKEEFEPVDMPCLHLESTQTNIEQMLSRALYYLGLSDENK